MTDIKIVIVEGIIGAGKSTMIPRMIEYLEGKGKCCIYVPEPVEEWKNSGMLDMFYSDIPKYAYMFHIYTLTTIYNNLKKHLKDAKPGDVLVCERSIFSVRYMFAQNLIDQGFFTPQQTQDFIERFEEFRKDLPDPSLIVWLDTPVSTCMERIHIRNRGKEITGVKQEYQQQLWDNHVKFFEDPNFPYKYVISPQISLDYIHRIGPKSDEDQFMVHVYHNLFK